MFVLRVRINSHLGSHHILPKLCVLHKKKADEEGIGVNVNRIKISTS